MSLTESDLAHFTGTTQWFRHGLVRSVTYTEGVQFVAEQVGAYWLIDKIAANQLDPRIGTEDFQVWRLLVKDSKGVLTCDDGDKIGVGGTKPIVLHSEQIDFTDFPLEKIDLWVEGGVILLPSEH